MRDRRMPSAYARIHPMLCWIGLGKHGEPLDPIYASYFEGQPGTGAVDVRLEPKTANQTGRRLTTTKHL